MKYIMIKKCNDCILHIEQIKKFQISEFMFHFAHSLLWPAFTGYFSSASDLHMHYTRSHGDYHGRFAGTNSRLFSLCETLCLK